MCRPAIYMPAPLLPHKNVPTDIGGISDGTSFSFPMPALS
jgi:hypothetical protein